jgi:hypothetical protein
MASASASSSTAKICPLGIPDWIAVPTARWASQDSIELVTAFGDVAADGSRERLCRHVFSYADELRGTLLGMRLMQADMVGMVEGLR